MLRILIIDSTRKAPTYLNKWIDDRQSHKNLSFDVISEREVNRVISQSSFDLLIHRVAMPAMHSNLDVKEQYPETPLFVLPVFSYHTQEREEEDKYMVQEIIPKILQRKAHSA